jgi:hypothetical protein
MGRDTSGQQLKDQHWLYATGHDKRVAQLDEAELIRVGEALMPKFPEVFRAAWDMHTTLPYQMGYARKPFRAPRSPKILLTVRRPFLLALMRMLHGYDQDLPWFAAHAQHLAPYGGADQLGVLFAAAIDLGGERGAEIEQILRDSAAGTHEVGQFGRHVTAGLLCSTKTDNWEFMEKMLLAAQRQEGLRQVIL